jgi:predicted metal-dependent hydrolase
LVTEAREERYWNEVKVLKRSWRFLGGGRELLVS